MQSKQHFQKGIIQSQAIISWQIHSWYWKKEK